MAIYSDFSSLLQLGVGVGIGLSLFRAPVDLRLAWISKTLDSEILAMHGSNSPFARTKRRDMQDLRLSLLSKKDSLNRNLVPFMFAAIVAAALNLAGLIAVSLWGERVASTGEIALFFLISVGWYLVELLALEALARYQLQSLTLNLAALRAKKAPPIQLPPEAH